MTCPSCSARAPEGAKFCGHCGQSLDQGTGGSVPTLSTIFGAPSGTLSDRRVVTVLFADVSGFTTISEHLDPEEVRDLMNSLFSYLADPIYRYGGVVDKYIGDAIMALFGAPVAHEDDPVRAARAAWEMQASAGRFLANLAGRVGHGMQVRIGLNSGLVVAAQVGAAQRADYTVMGDTVNLAQRMETYARPGKILVAAETYRLTRHVCAFEPVERIKVKGKTEPVEVYEMMGLLPNTAFLHPAGCRLIGRRQELEQLNAAWAKARAGQPRFVAIVGEKGIGKSLLVRRFLDQPFVRDLRLVRARCLSYRQDSAFALLANLVRSLAGTPESEDPRQVGAAFAGLLARWHPQPELASEAIMTLLSGNHGAPGAASDGRLQTEARLAVDGVLMDLARRKPLILSLVDLQWADTPSLLWLQEFLGRLADEDGPCSILVVAQGRPEGSFDPTPTSEDGCLIRLETLSPEDAMDLAACLLGVTPGALDPPVIALLEDLVGRADGNPYYLCELVTGLKEAKVLERRGASWSLAASAPDRIVPRSISAAILARLDRLPAELRTWVQAAAVLGRRFSADALGRIAQADPMPAIAALASQEIFSLGFDGEVAFTQGMIQEVAYESLLVAQRRQWHARAGEALASLPAPDFAQIAHHFEHAQDAPQIARFRHLLGRHNARSQSHGEARAAFRAALAWLDQVRHTETTPDVPARHDIVADLARSETALGNIDEALYLLGTLPERVRNSAAILRTQARAFEMRGDLKEALAAYEAAANASGEPHERAETRAAMADVYRRLGDFAVASAHAQDALAQLEGDDFPAIKGLVYGVLGVCRQRQGDLEGALAAHQMAMHLRITAGDSEGLASSHNNLGSVAQALGRWEEARQSYAASLALYRKIGNRLNLAMVLNNLGDLLLAAGEDDLAERHFREALRLARALGSAPLEVVALASLAETYLIKGAGDVALGFVDESLSLSRDTGHAEYGPELELARGRALCLLGDWEGAEAEFERARTWAQTLGNEPLTGIVDRARAQAALARGNPAEARLLASRSVASARSANSPLPLARSLILLAQLSGEPERGELAREALALFRRLGARREEEAASAAVASFTNCE